MEKCDTKDRCPKENNKRKCVKMLDSSVGALDHDVQKKNAAQNAEILYFIWYHAQLPVKRVFWFKSKCYNV